MSRRPVQAPVSSPGIRPGETVITHPAFGMIGANRVEGKTFLNGSDFEHGRFICIRLLASELHRDLSRDWHFGREGLFEVTLSEAQWATFVSSMNVVQGVPCTIRSLPSDPFVPALPTARGETQSYKDEIAETVRDAIEKLRGLRAKLPGPRQRELDLAIQELEKNLPFVAKSFEESVEKHVERAKIEINAYLVSTVNRAGLSALGAEAPTLLVDHTKDAA